MRTDRLAALVVPAGALLLSSPLPAADPWVLSTVCCCPELTELRAGELQSANGTARSQPGVKRSGTLGSDARDGSIAPVGRPEDRQSAFGAPRWGWIAI